MDFLKKFTEATKIDTTKETPAPTGAGTADEQAPSQSDVFASAQVLAQAAKATINKDPTNVDNYKLAGAAADILDAAEHYGKLDTTTGVGSYVEKAEGYLKQYETSNSPPPPAKSPVETEPKSAAPAEDTVEKKGPIPAEETTEVTEKAVAPPPAATEAPEEASEEKEKAIPTHVAETEETETEEIPAAAAAAAAKEEPAGESKEEGGYGGALKAAGDFWKKN